MLRTVSRDSLARNSIMIMASTVGTSGLGYLYWMLAARALPQSAVGVATALVSAATVISMVSNLGIGHMFIQRLPGSLADGWPRIVSSGLVLGCAATALVAVVVAVVLPAVAANFTFLHGIAAGTALATAAVALTASTLLDYVFVAHRASQGMLWRNLALAAGKVLTLFALTSAGLHTAGAALLAWTLPSIAVSLYTVRVGLHRLHSRAGAEPLPRQSGRLSVAGLRSEARHIRRALRGHHLINLAQAGPAALLPVLVTARLGASANAHFYVAWMTASILFMVSPAVASAFYAERSNAAGARSASLPRAAAVVLAVIGPPAVLLLLAGGWILGLFSAGYAAGGALLLQILVLAAIPDAITNLAVAYWRSLGEFRRCLRLNLLMAAICLALTWLWLPGSEIAAAGYAWLTGQSAGALIVAVTVVRRRLAASREAAASRETAAAEAAGPATRVVARLRGDGVRRKEVPVR